MAKVLGPSGSRVNAEAVRARKSILHFCCVTAGLLGTAAAIIVIGWFPTSWLSDLGWLAVLSTLLFAIWALNKWAFRKIEAVEQKGRLPGVGGGR